MSVNIFEDGEMKPIDSYKFTPGTFVAPLAEYANHANTANIATIATKVVFPLPKFFEINKNISGGAEWTESLPANGPGIYIVTANISSAVSEGVTSRILIRWTDETGQKHSVGARSTMNAGGGAAVSAVIASKDGNIVLSTDNYADSTRDMYFQATLLKLGDL